MTLQIPDGLNASESEQESTGTKVENKISRLFSTLESKGTVIGNGKYIQGAWSIELKSPRSV